MSSVVKSSLVPMFSVFSGKPGPTVSLLDLHPCSGSPLGGDRPGRYFSVRLSYPWFA